ncbi:MAG: phosphatidate cytidylyltransferase [Alphaproteobacteria bacterium]|nr:phosphatidate cytidylyltransferase [Alphaproteobacteria bacterium]
MQFLNPELRKRLLVAIPALLLLLGVWWWLGTWGLLILITLATMGLAFELTTLQNPNQSVATSIVYALLAGGAVVMVYFGGGLGIVAFVMMLLMVLWPVDESRLEHQATMTILLVVILAATGLVHVLRAYGTGTVIFVVLVAQLGDTTGFFVGKATKGKKAFPVLSPNKTLAGCLGHLFASVIISLLFMLLVFFPMVSTVEQGGFPSQAETLLLADGTPIGTLLANWGGSIVQFLVAQSEIATVIVALLAGVVLSVAAQLGDIWVSMIKRRVGEKDTGWLLPGHGGLGDRLDSVLGVGAVAYPLFALCELVARVTQ